MLSRYATSNDGLMTLFKETARGVEANVEPICVSKDDAFVAVTTSSNESQAKNLLKESDGKKKSGFGTSSDVWESNGPSGSHFILVEMHEGNASSGVNNV